MRLQDRLQPSAITAESVFDSPVDPYRACGFVRKSRSHRRGHGGFGTMYTAKSIENRRMSTNLRRRYTPSRNTPLVIQLTHPTNAYYRINAS